MKTLRPRSEVEPSTQAASPAAVSVLVDAEYEGQRLDNFVSRHCRGVPRSHVYQLIRSGQVRVNGGRASADQRLSVGDRVRLPPVTGVRPKDTPSGGQHAHGPNLPLLFEDDSLLVIDKPAGVAVHGGSGVSLGAIEALRRQRPQTRFLELVHRLDRETSGVLVVATRRAALVGLQQQFRDRSTAKTYLAVVAGRWPLRTRTISAPLERLAAPDGDRRVRVSEQGREAITRVTGLMHFDLAGSDDGATLVVAAIETGRTHQIRVHLSHAGHPVIGDDKYGDFAFNKSLRSRGHGRMFLHAYRLELIHPVSSERQTFEAPVPQSFARLIGNPGSIEAIVGHPLLARRRRAA